MADAIVFPYFFLIIKTTDVLIMLNMGKIHSHLLLYFLNLTLSEEKLLKWHVYLLMCAYITMYRVLLESTYQAFASMDFFFFKLLIYGYTIYS